MNTNCCIYRAASMRLGLIFAACLDDALIILSLWYEYVATLHLCTWHVVMGDYMEGRLFLFGMSRDLHYLDSSTVASSKLICCWLKTFILCKSVSFDLSKTMNWTGGRLQRHSENAGQKHRFAKSRLRNNGAQLAPVFQGLPQFREAGVHEHVHQVIV